MTIISSDFIDGVSSGGKMVGQSCICNQKGTDSTPSQSTFM